MAQFLVNARAPEIASLLIIMQACDDRGKHRGQRATAAYRIKPRCELQACSVVLDSGNSRFSARAPQKKSPCHWLTAHDWETVDLVSPGHKLSRAVRAQRPAVCVLCVWGFVLCARSEVYVCTEIDAGALDSE